MMRVLDRFIELFSFVADDHKHVPNQGKVKLFNLTLFLFFLFTFSQGVYSLISENALFAFVSLFFSSLFLIGLMLSYNKYASWGWPLFHASAIMAYMVFIHMTGGISGAASFSIMVYPFLAVLFCGKRNGLLLSLLLVLVVSVLMFVPIQFPGVARQMVFEVKIAQMVMGVMASVLAYAIRHVWEESIMMRERELLEAHNNSNLKEELIVQLSHQIRTPLSNIIGVVDLMEKMPLNDVQCDYVNTIHASANNLVNVVNGMVAANLNGITPLPSEEISFNIYATINNTLRLFQDKGNHKKFSVSLSPDIPVLLIGNSIRIKQIFLNVINSLLKYNQGEFKKIYIEVNRSEIIQGRMDLFFRISTNFQMSSGKASATGSESNRYSTARIIQQLDLGLTQKLIEADGKNLSIHTIGEGLIVEFAVGFRENVQSSSLNAMHEKPKVSDTFFRNKVDMKDASILIVEDNFSNQQIITLYIKNEVHKIDVAFNGKEALDKFGTSKYDLILMDVQMPIMDGFKATQKIRDIEKSYNTRIPIIAVTANAFPEDRERCLQAGMDDYISKPFQPEELISKIRNLLN